MVESKKNIRKGRERRVVQIFVGDYRRAVRLSLRRHLPIYKVIGDALRNEEQREKAAKCA